MPRGRPSLDAMPERRNHGVTAVESGFDGSPWGDWIIPEKRGRSAMQATTSSDLDDSAMFVEEIADEALERAACAEAGYARAFTVAFCTGQAECPF